MKGILTKKQADALLILCDGTDKMKNKSSKISKASLRNLRRRRLIICETSKAWIEYGTATLSCEGRDVADSFKMTSKG